MRLAEHLERDPGAVPVREEKSRARTKYLSE